MSQGGEAMRQGDNLKQQAEALLVEYSFQPVVLGSDSIGSIQELPTHLKQLLVPAKGVLARDAVVGRTLYERNLHCDFLLYRHGWPEVLALWCRHQQGSGTTDEKLPYLWANIWREGHCKAAILLEGDRLKSDPVFKANVWFARKSGGKIRRIFKGLYDLGQWGKLGCPFPLAMEPILL